MPRRLFLVTGGAGFIGSHIVEALVARGDDVRVLDNLSTGKLENLGPFLPDIEVVRGDVTDPCAVADAMHGVDCVFHEAALASVPLSIDRPLDSHAACATGTLNVLEQARRAGVRRVVYAGSAATYGDRPTSAKRESDLPNVLSPYGAAKLSGELYCQAYAAMRAVETVVVRYFNVFGPRQDPDSPYSAVIPLFLRAILSEQRPTVYGDGMQSRDFTFVSDVAQGNLLAADAPGVSGQVFNIASGRSHSLIELLDTLNELLGSSIEPIHAPPRMGDIRESMADITQARQALGFEPRVSFRDGLERSIEYYRQLVAASLIRR